MAIVKLDFRCPVHKIPDCSPILNGCSIPIRFQEYYASGRAEVISDLESLGSRVALTRKRRKLAYRAVEAQTGISKGNLHKIEHGGNPGLQMALKLLRWLES